MLPTPPISVWSSRARLTSVCRRRSAAVKESASNRGSSGSIAMCASRGGMSSPSGASSTARPPNVRWSTKRSSRPPSVNRTRARRCTSSGSSGFSTSSCPLIPRCATRARPDGAPSGSASGSHRYFPRRRAAGSVRPVSAATKWSVPSRCRRTARGWCTSTEATVRPATQRSRPRRTTSTSGSSGTSAPRGSAVGSRGEGAPGGFRGLLLGGLLRPAGAHPADLAGQHHDRGEGLGVVGTVVLDVVDRSAQALAGAQLLQAGLPVQAGTPGGRLGQQRVEQPVHDGGGGVQAETEVDGADERLQRVGEDRLLLLTAGRPLSAAQQQVRTDAAVPEG